MQDLAGRLAALQGWHRLVAALALGAASATALPPLHVLPALIVAYTGLVWLLDGCRNRRQAWATGWWFGYGQFIVGLYWTGNALLTDAERFAWLVPFSVLGLPALLALFPATATLVVHLSRVGGLARVGTLAVAWTVAEWLRGHVLTGFPWNLVGYAWVVSEEVLQVAALVGIYGLSLITVLLAATPATLSIGGPGARFAHWRPSVIAVIVLAAIWIGGSLRLDGATVTEFDDVRLRIVQANIDQHHKWRADLRKAQLGRYLQLSSQVGEQEISHVIWPETATPFFLAKEPGVLALIGGLVEGNGVVLTGAPRTTSEISPDQPQVWNSLHAIDATGALAASYDKQHLVPFGEYVPLRQLLGRLGITKITGGAVDFSAGTGARTLHIGTLPAFAALICYEVIFPAEIVDTDDRPQWLLNVTNDAWFGHSSGPHQHFAMARVRAVEQGLGLVRAANTGISAIVDPYGRVRAHLSLGVEGVLDGGLPRPLATLPLYARWGDWTVLLFAISWFLLLTFTKFGAQKKQPRVYRVVSRVMSSWTAGAKAR